MKIDQNLYPNVGKKLIVFRILTTIAISSPSTARRRETTDGRADVVSQGVPNKMTDVVP